jgi:hypothetical protein
VKTPRKNISKKQNITTWIRQRISDTPRRSPPRDMPGLTRFALER